MWLEQYGVVVYETNDANWFKHSEDTNSQT